MFLFLNTKYSLHICFFTGCDGIKMRGLIAKTWVTIGESAKLICDYELGRDAMYSIKWFKDDAELVRERFCSKFPH